SVSFERFTCCKEFGSRNTWKRLRLTICVYLPRLDDRNIFNRFLFDDDDRRFCDGGAFYADRLDHRFRISQKNSFRFNGSHPSYKWIIKWVSGPVPDTHFLCEDLIPLI